MTGYTVHTGSTKKLTDNWDSIFDGGKKKRARKKTAGRKKAKKKVAGKTKRTKK